MSENYSIHRVKISLTMCHESSSYLLERCSILFYANLQEILRRELSIIDRSAGDFYIDEAILINVGEVSEDDFEYELSKQFEFIIKNELKSQLLVMNTNWMKRLLILANSQLSYELIRSELLRWPHHEKSSIAEYLLSYESRPLCNELPRDFVRALCRWIVPDIFVSDVITQNTLLLTAIHFLQRKAKCIVSLKSSSNFSAEHSYNTILHPHDIFLLKGVFIDNAPSTHFSTELVHWLYHLWQSPLVRENVMPAMPAEHLKNWERWFHEAHSIRTHLYGDPLMLMEGEGEGEGEAPSVSPYCPRRNPVEEHTLMLAEGLPGKRLPDTNSAASKLLDLSAMFSDQQSCHRLPDMFKEPSYWVHHGGEQDFLTLHQVPGSAPKLTDTYNGGSTEDYSVLREESESTAGIFSRNRRAPYPSPYDTEHDVTPSLQPYIMHSRFLQKKIVRKQPSIQRDSLPWTVQKDNSSWNQLSLAGITLLWPLLPGLFQQLGLMEHNQFISLEAQQQAAASLDWLALEDQLSLLPTISRWLCGLPTDNPKDNSSLDEVIQEQLKCWRFGLPSFLQGTLKRLSVTDIFQLFLLRPGWLSANIEQNTLYIKPEVYDVMLKDWPWPVDIIFLPWLKQTLSVRWIQPQSS